MFIPSNAVLRGVDVATHYSLSPICITGFQSLNDFKVMRSASQELVGLVICKSPHYQWRFDQHGHQHGQARAVGEAVHRSVELAVEDTDALDKAGVDTKLRRRDSAWRELNARCSQLRSRLRSATAVVALTEEVKKRKAEAPTKAEKAAIAEKAAKAGKAKKAGKTKKADKAEAKKGSDGKKKQGEKGGKKKK